MEKHFWPHLYSIFFILAENVIYVHVQAVRWRKDKYHFLIECSLPVYCPRPWVAMSIMIPIIEIPVVPTISKTPLLKKNTFYNYSRKNPAARPTCDILNNLLIILLNMLFWLQFVFFYSCSLEQPRKDEHDWSLWLQVIYLWKICISDKLKSSRLFIH